MVSSNKYIKFVTKIVVIFYRLFVDLLTNFCQLIAYNKNLHVDLDYLQVKFGENGNKKSKQIFKYLHNTCYLNKDIIK